MSALMLPPTLLAAACRWPIRITRREGSLTDAMPCTAAQHTMWGSWTSCSLRSRWVGREEGDGGERGVPSSIHHHGHNKG